MKLNQLKPAGGAKKNRRRVGRGLGSGRGKTAGRGHKGQKSRSGFSQGSGWEGGRSRLIMRLPKRGFNREKRIVQIVNLADLNRFESGSTIGAALLAEHGLVRSGDAPVKLLGEGDLRVERLQIEVDAWSAGALAAVRASGGDIIGAADVGHSAASAAEAPAAPEAPADAATAAGAAAEGAADEAAEPVDDEDEEQA